MIIIDNNRMIDVDDIFTNIFSEICYNIIGQKEVIVANNRAIDIDDFSTILKEGFNDAYSCNAFDAFFTNIKNFKSYVWGDGGVPSTNDPPPSPGGSRYPHSTNNHHTHNILYCNYESTNNLPCDICNRYSASLRFGVDCPITANRYDSSNYYNSKQIAIMKRKNYLDQEFEIESGEILSLVRVERDAEGKRLETPFVAMLLDNGDGINLNISAIGRAISHKVRWEHLYMLSGAKVVYCTSERAEGEEFTWRPSDNKALTATSSGAFKSVLGIKVRDKYEATIEAMPIYVAEIEEQAMPDDPKDHSEDDGGSGIPEGAKAIAEPNLVAKSNKK